MDYLYFLTLSRVTEKTRLLPVRKDIDWRKREIKNFKHSTRVGEHNAEAKCTTLVVDTKKAMENSNNTQMKRNNCRKK